MTLTKQERKLYNKLSYKLRYGGKEGKKKNKERMAKYRLALKLKSAILKK